MADRLRVAVLSGVRHADNYLPVFASDPRVELLGVVQDVSEAAADLFVVCSEPTRHARLAADALDAGAHVLVDKPMTTALDDAVALCQRAERSVGTLSVVNLLQAPAIRRARGWIDAGHIGFPRHVDVEFLSNGALFTSNVESAELVADPALSGGGELANFLVYPVDYLRYLTGCEVREVHAEAATLFFEPHRRFGVEDSAVLSLSLDHGVTATMTVARVPFAPTNAPTSLTARVLGSHGHVEVDEDAPQVTRYDADGIDIRPADEPLATAGVGACLRTLVGDLLAGRAPEYEPTDGLAAVAVIDAAYRSVETGQPAQVHVTRERG